MPQNRGIQNESYRIALASVSTERPLLDVELAVVGAGLQVDEVGVGVRLEALEPGQQHPTASVLLLLDLVRAVKLLLQDLPDLKWHIKGFSPGNCE